MCGRIAGGGPAAGVSVAAVCAVGGGGGAGDLAGELVVVPIRQTLSFEIQEFPQGFPVLQFF